jgi:rare lipoprotein A
MAYRVLRRGMKLLALLSVMAAPSGVLAATATGKASYYSHAGRTASGAMFDRNAMTAAHRSAPFGTRLKVTNLTNQRSTIVTVTDRGPFIRGRIIDVSARAADVLGFRRAGVARVAVEKAD